MFDALVNIINEKHEPLKESELNALQDYAVFRTYKKNEVILNETTLSQTIFFVLKGYLRVFYDVKGMDKTTFFHSKGKFVWTGSQDSFQLTSRENYQALKTTTLLHFHPSKIERLFKLFPKLERIARLNAEKGLREYQQFIASFLLLSPEERFLELILVLGNHLFELLALRPEIGRKMSGGCLSSSSE